MEPKEALGARYVLIRAESGKKGIDWRSVEEICGRFADRLLLPEGLQPPGDTILKEPSFPRFSQQLLLHTACELIARTRMPMYRRVLGLIDGDGAHAGMLHQLLKYFTSVKVYTQDTEGYKLAADRMMEELGAPVFVTDTLDSLRDCVLTLSPGAFYTGEALRLPCPVMAADAFVTSVRCEMITGLQAGISQEIRESCPGQIAPERFTAALYEFCGTEPETFVAGRLLCNYKGAGLDEAAKLVAMRAGLEPNRC